MTARGMPTSAHSRHSERVRVVDAVVRGDHEERAVGGAQAGPQLTDEVGVPGGVDQVDLDAVVHQRRDRERDRAFVGVLGLLEVAHRRALADGARAGDSSRRGEQRLDQCRLPGAARAHHTTFRIRSGLLASRSWPAGLRELPLSAIARTSCSDQKGNSSSRARARGIPEPIRVTTLSVMSRVMGRVALLSEVRHLLAQGVSVALDGPPGIGKSALLDALESSVDALRPPRQRRPLRAVHAVRRAPGPDRPAPGRPGRRRSRGAPAAAAGWSALPRATTCAARSAVPFRTLLDELVADGRRVLILLDDAHWLDPDSACVLGYARRRLVGASAWSPPSDPGSGTGHRPHRPGAARRTPARRRRHDRPPRPARAPGAHRPAAARRVRRRTRPGPGALRSRGGAAVPARPTVAAAGPDRARAARAVPRPARGRPGHPPVGRPAAPPDRPPARAGRTAGRRGGGTPRGRARAAGPLRRRPAVHPGRAAPGRGRVHGRRLPGRAAPGAGRGRPDRGRADAAPRPRRPAPGRRVLAGAGATSPQTPPPEAPARSPPSSTSWRRTGRRAPCPTNGSSGSPPPSRPARSATTPSSCTGRWSTCWRAPATPAQMVRVRVALLELAGSGVAAMDEMLDRRPGRRGRRRPPGRDRAPPAGPGGPHGVAPGRRRPARRPGGAPAPAGRRTRRPGHRADGPRRRHPLDRHRSPRRPPGRGADPVRSSPAPG